MMMMTLIVEEISSWKFDHVNMIYSVYSSHNLPIILRWPIKSLPFFNTIVTDWNKMCHIFVAISWTILCLWCVMYTQFCDNSSDSSHLQIGPSWWAEESAVTVLFNSLRSRDVIWRQPSWSTMAKLMACRLFGTKPIPEQLWTCFQEPKENPGEISVEISTFYLNMSSAKYQPFCYSRIYNASLLHTIFVQLFRLTTKETPDFNPQIIGYWVASLISSQLIW